MAEEGVSGQEGVAHLRDGRAVLGLLVEELEMVEDVPARQRVAFTVLRDEDHEFVLPDGEEPNAAVVPDSLVGRLIFAEKMKKSSRHFS